MHAHSEIKSSTTVFLRPWCTSGRRLRLQDHHCRPQVAANTLGFPDAGVRCRTGEVSHQDVVPGPEYGLTLRRFGPRHRENLWDS